MDKPRHDLPTSAPCQLTEKGWRDEEGAVLELLLQGTGQVLAQGCFGLALIVRASLYLQEG